LESGAEFRGCDAFGLVGGWGSHGITFLPVTRRPVARIG
jgi:hypothetical protein